MPMNEDSWRFFFFSLPRNAGDTKAHAYYNTGNPGMTARNLVFLRSWRNDTRTGTGTVFDDATPEGCTSEAPPL